MPSDKPKDAGLPPALADALAAMSAEHRSMRVLEQIRTEELEGGGEVPADQDSADAAMGARLAARTRAHAADAQRAIALVAGLARTTVEDGESRRPAATEALAAEAASSDGVVADHAEELDTAKLLALEQARRDHDDSRLG